MLEAVQLAHEYEAFKIGRGKRGIQSAKVRFQKNDIQIKADDTIRPETLQTLKEDIMTGMKNLIQKEIRNNHESLETRSCHQNTKSQSPKTPKYNKCHYCNWNGHWIDECRKFKRDFPDPDFRDQVKTKLIQSKQNSLNMNLKQSPVSPKSFPGKSPSKIKSPKGRIMVAGHNNPIRSENYETSLAMSNESMYLPVTVFEIPLNSLVDSGSTLTLIHPDQFELIPSEIRPSLLDKKIKLRMADGGIIESKGEAQIPIQIGNYTFQHIITVAEVEAPLVLGYDFLTQYGCLLDFKTCSFQIHGQKFPCIRVDHTEKILQVIVTETVTLPPHSETIFSGKIVTPKQKPTEFDCAMVKQIDSHPNMESLILAKSLVNPNELHVPLRLANLSDTTQQLSKNTIIATCEPAFPCDKLDIESKSDETKSFCPNNTDNQIPSHLQKMWDDCKDNLTSDQKESVIKLLNQVEHLFSKGKTDIGKTDLVTHKIDTGDSQPIKQAPRRLPFSKRQESEQEIQNMLNRGIIEPSSSPWSSPIVLVRKKDGSLRFCIDYRKLNSVTKKDSYPLPRIDDSLDALGNAKWFSTLDLSSSYWQVKMHPDHKEKTAFVTTSGLYHFNVLSFGLTNAPATFQRLMEYILAGLQWHTCLLYLDDIIVFSKDFESHIENLCEILERIEKAGLKLNPKKCHLFNQKVGYLGHIVSAEGISTNPEKVHAVTNWPEPIKISELRSFLGFCSYYRRFIPNFATIAHPLNQLLEKDIPFNWTKQCKDSFETLKQLLVSSPILAYPIPEKPYILDIDASHHGIGAVLSQEQDGQERPIGYYSRTLSKSERNYCVTRKELLAVIQGIKHFHHYLYGTSFLIRTDHGALKWLLNFKEPEGQIARWFQFLSTYNFTIQHIAGTQHGNADGLSRRPCIDDPCRYCNGQDQRETNRSLSKIPCITPSIHRIANQTIHQIWLHDKSKEDLQKLQLEDSHIKLLLQWKKTRKERPCWSEISRLDNKMKTYLGIWEQLRIIDDILYRKIHDPITGNLFQLVLPQSLHSEIFTSLHSDVTSGHLGVNRTIDRFKMRFYWPNMREDISKWCRECLLCQQRKGPLRKPRSPMQQYLVGAPMERIALDILGPLPESYDGNKYILVIADYFSKWVDAWPMKNMETPTIVDILIQHVICQWGVPLFIHSDRGTQFESDLFQQLCSCLGITKTKTTAYRPQSDGMVERMNRTIEEMLSKYVAENQRDWDKYLPLVLSAYRTSTHNSTGFSPALLFLGREPKLPVDLLMGYPPQDESYEPPNYQEYVDKLVDKMHKVHELTRDKLLVASNHQKKNYDHRKNRIDFKKGEAVLLQNTKKRKGHSPKLQARWEIPYLVLDLISDFVYKIQKRPRSKELIVHHDRLKKFYGPYDNWLEAKPDDEIDKIDEVEINPDTELNKPENEELSKENCITKPSVVEKVKDSYVTRSGRKTRSPSWLIDYE